jgi:hypothetical protein
VGSIFVLSEEESELRGVAMPEVVRREALVLLRDSVPLREKKRRVEELRFGGAEKFAAGESGGEEGPRREFRRWRAESQSVQGWVWDSPMWPQPLCWV